MCSCRGINYRDKTDMPLLGQYPIVVMPVMMTHFAMLQRKLLYTGVTRAKKGLVLAGAFNGKQGSAGNVCAT